MNEEIPILNSEQNKIFAKLASKFLENKTEFYLRMRDTPWSIETDALVYIDDDGVDTASFGDGADFITNKYLTEDEINILSNQGYFVKGEYIFAFSRFLLEQFVKATLLLQIAEDAQNRTEGMLRGLINTIMSTDGEVIKDQKLLHGGGENG